MPSERKLLLGFFWTGSVKKAFTRSIVAYYVPGDVSTCSNKDATSVLTVAVRVTILVF